MAVAQDFEEFIACLTAHGVEFVIVGAYALAFHGAPRFTGALDVLIRPTIDNAARVLTALDAFGFPLSELTPAQLADSRRMIEIGVPPVQIHLMSAISGVEWSDVWAHKVEGMLGEQAAPFIGRETLIANKRAASRPKDLADVDALESGDDR